MKYVYMLIFVVISLNSFAEEGREWIPQVWLVSSEIDTKLNEKESQYVFEFNNILKSEDGTKILYSIDSNTHNGILDVDNKLYIKSSPGIHIFQFYYNDQHLEIYTDSLKILPQYTDSYRVRFESSEFPIVLKKPIIYLYPETEINFSVEVNPTGELSFTYPIYNNGWKGIASPNGEINIENNTYSYLFWESNQSINMNLIDTKKGAIVKGSESLEYIEAQLNKFGFTSKEKADFITFWVPQLQQNEYNYVNFVLNNDADIFAELSVIPAPDHIYRFYMLSSKIENPDDFYYLEPQLIESIDRKGFVVLEWGGSKVDINIEKLNHRRI